MSATTNTPNPSNSAGQPAGAAKKKPLRRTPEQRLADLKTKLARTKSEEQSMHYRSAAMVGFAILSTLRDAKSKEQITRVVHQVLVHTTRPADQRARDRAVWELLRILPESERDQVRQDALTKARSVKPDVVDVQPFAVVMPHLLAAEAAAKKSG